MAVDEVQLGTDEVERAPGVLGRQARRVAEALEDGLLGGRPVLSSRDAVLDGIGDRGSQLALDVLALALRDAAERRREVALGQRGHRFPPLFRVWSDAVSVDMSVMSCEASSMPAAFVR